MRQLGVLLLVLAMCCLSSNAKGEPITDPSQLSPNPAIIDFEQFTAGPVNNPLVIGDVTFSTTEPEAGLDIRDITGYPADGTEVESLLLQTIPHYMHLIITFSNPVSEVLLGWWDPNFPGNFLRAYDVNNQLLEEVELTDLDDAGGVHATWIGFKRPYADISRIEVDPATYPPYDHYGIDNIYYNVTPATVPIAIDIKPDHINPKSKGKIEVAILSTNEFNAPEMVDIESLTFGRTGAEDSLAFCARKIKDFDKDGSKDDLVCKFYIQDLGFQSQCGDTEGILQGKTKDGTPIQGSDSVEIAPCH
jgi:hypothetical protein